MKKIHPTESQLDVIRLNADTGEISISELSRRIGLDRTVVRRIIKDDELNDKYSQHKIVGRQRPWSEDEEYQLSIYYGDRTLGTLDIARLMNRSEDDVIATAKRLRIFKKRKLSVTAEQIEDIENWDGTMEHVEKLATKYKLTNEGMRLRIRRVQEGYKRKKVYPAFPETPDNYLMTYLNNTSLTAKEISRETGFSPYAIQGYRRNHMPDFTIRKDYNSDFSEPEIQFVKILEEMDLAFIPHKRIDNYTVDIYLGKRKYVEIQGYKWHSSPSQIKNDEKKRKYLKNLGYLGLEIECFELDDKEKIKDMVNNLLAHNKPR